MSQESIGTRERIVEAARYLFWERGYASASMSDILARASANSGSFYHFFDSKEALLREVLEAYLHGLGPAILDPARRSAPDPIERIFAVLAGYRERLTSTGYTYGCPLGRLALEVDAENRPAHDLIAANFSAWTGAIRSFLDEAADRLPPDLDRAGLATLVLSVMEGGVMQSRARRKPEPFDRSVALLRDYFDRLLSNPSSRRIASRTNTKQTKSADTKQSAVLRRAPRPTSRLDRRPHR